MNGIRLENIVVGLEAKDNGDAIMKMVECLADNGHVNTGYYDDVMEREAKYPTGLPTEGVKIAIPHANSEHILDSTIGVAVLDKPVDFLNMADDTEQLAVEIIFLIANTEAAQQAKLLSVLMENFSDEEVLMKMRNANDAKEVYELIQAM